MATGKAASPDADGTMSASAVDPWVQASVPALCGTMYRGLRGRLSRYPIPELRLGPGEGRWLLDIGCSWGRWSLAAAGQGYYVLGLDPSWPAIAAARRVTRQLGLKVHYIVADGRDLPLARGSFDVVNCYNVLQHLPKGEVCRVFGEIRRVLRERGEAILQLPGTFGVRSLYNQAKSRLRQPGRLQMYYWRVTELQRAIEMSIGPAEVQAEGFLNMNPQPGDRDLLPLPYQALVTLSERLRRLSRQLPVMRHLADALVVHVRVRG